MEEVQDLDLQACTENPRLQTFLERNDRDIDVERRTYGVKIVFAGADSPTLRDGLYRIGVRHIRVSYHSMHNWLRRRPIEEISADLGRFDFVILDSGAFSLVKANVAEARVYADRFYQEVLRYGHLFNGICEVDLRDKLGLAYTESQKRVLLDKGLPIIPVIHGAHELTIYEGLGWFEDYPYIAVGSELFKPGFEQYRSEVFDLGRKRGVVFHGLASAGVDSLERSQFYSVETSSWLGGSRYGTTVIFDNGRLKYHDKELKSVRVKYRERFEDNGLNWEDIAADKALEVNMMNALAWRQLSDYTKYASGRSYWLTVAEREQSVEYSRKVYNSEGIINRDASLRRATARRLNVVSDLTFDDRAHETLHCDTCNVRGRCPRYRPKNPCGYDINIRIETQADVQRAMQMVMEIQHGRLMTGVLFEKLEGGVLDKNVSAELKLYTETLSSMREMFEPRGEELEIKVKARSNRGGGLRTMLASALGGGRGSAGIGSGSSQTQRKSRALAETSNVEVLEPEAEPSVIDKPMPT